VVTINVEKVKSDFQKAADKMKFVAKSFQRFSCLSLFIVCSSQLNWTQHNEKYSSLTLTSS